MQPSGVRRGPAEWLMVLCGAWLVGLGVYFVFLRPPLLPEDVRYMALDPQVLAAAAPGLSRWLGHVFTVMGGFMAGAGVLVAYLARGRVRARGAVMVLAVAGLLTVGLMSAVNFALHSDFRWVLAVPPAAWLVSLLLQARSAA